MTEVNGQIIGQDSSRLYFTGVSFHYGVIVTEPILKPFAQSNPVMVQSDFSFINNTQRAWYQCNCYNKTGLSLSYMDFKNEQILGNALNLSVYTEPFLYYSQSFQFGLRGGAGLSYLNNGYDVDLNPDNLFYSSPVSFLLTLGLSVNFKISEAFNAGLTTQFSHISNGGARYPNWGINYPALGVKVDYQINKPKIIPRAHEKLVEYPLKLILQAAAGQHLDDGTRKVVAQINTGLIKQLSRINGVGVGSELVYDGINEVLEERSGESYNSLMASVSLQHYFYFGRLLFGQQFAYYVVPPNSNADKTYQVYTLGFHITNQWYGGVLLRAHANISDYLAISLAKVIILKH
jgi:hypothetical protein